MQNQKWSTVFLGITCALCIFIAFLVFIVALIYMSVFVISAPKNAFGGCSKTDQLKGIECAPKIEELSVALEQMDTESADPEKFKKIANVCKTTLECVEPIKCRSFAQEYEFVKYSCAMFEVAADDVNFCLKKLQKRFLHGDSGCLSSSPITNERQIMCQLFDADRPCSEAEILMTCGRSMEGKEDELLDKILKLFECRKY